MTLKETWLRDTRTSTGPRLPVGLRAGALYGRGGGGLPQGCLGRVETSCTGGGLDLLKVSDS